MASRRLRSRASLTAESSNASSRPRRGVAAPAARIERTSPEEIRQSIHLTVKAPPSKLRQATSGSSRNVSGSSRAGFAGGEIVNGPRGTRNKKVILDETSEEEDDDEDEEPEEMDDDDEEEEEADEDDDDIDAEGEDDVEMEDAPPPPPVAKPRGVARLLKPSINVTPAPDVSSVEAKEMAMANDDDDDDLSELDSQEEDDEDEGGDEDAEGEDDDMEDVERDDDLDSDDDTHRTMSRSHTPDLSKLTRRQRAMAEETDSGLMFLSNEAQKKKHLTAEEHAMRRAEMARRRKNLSEKRNEEEKMDTINRLLKKQPPKRRGRAAADNGESGQDDEPEVEKASPLYVRYTQTIKGSQVAVPEEWLSSPIGTVFTGAVPAPNPPRPFTGRMVEEVA
ncbi:uncharacterized protein BDZ99DRAFT_167287 [Mytilinidion resinicola]|uniref:INO80 complex subunit B-like conserved region domain-containing protein n=1 Tax=Mytilinidion resinicola TaxID=574789 RepID=A0A6A6Y4Z5_9PEZI|nr:uncharacterized protein BDZ99DRAFT_167287 [Mytilinidion resinicola]KAF2803593.1 hypothetical protein BDZ99DRAFT_167287 [Mytilinidion resinicola]